MKEEANMSEDVNEQVEGADKFVAEKTGGKVEESSVKTNARQFFGQDWSRREPEDSFNYHKKWDHRNDFKDYEAYNKWADMNEKTTKRRNEGHLSELLNKLLEEKDIHTTFLEEEGTDYYKLFKGDPKEIPRTDNNHYEYRIPTYAGDQIGSLDITIGTDEKNDVLGAYVHYNFNNGEAGSFGDKTGEDYEAKICQLISENIK